MPLKDDDRTPEETQKVVAKFRKSDLGTTPGFLRPFLVVDDTGAGCFPNDASSGGIDEVLSAGPGPTSRSTTRRCRSRATARRRRRPDATAQSRFECFKQKFEQQLAADDVPQFTYMTLRERPHGRARAPAGARRTR